MEATCQCGQLRAIVPDQGGSAVACHCIACQKRSGSPFGVIVYYDAASVTIIGEAREYTRIADSGAPFTTGFCPICGTTLYARTARHPGGIGITVGAFGNPAFPAPVRSVFEECRHEWVSLPDRVQRFPRGRVE